MILNLWVVYLLRLLVLHDHYKLFYHLPISIHAVLSIPFHLFHDNSHTQYHFFLHLIYKIPHSSITLFFNFCGCSRARTCDLPLNGDALTNWAIHPTLPKFRTSFWASLWVNIVGFEPTTYLTHLARALTKLSYMFYLLAEGVVVPGLEPGTSTVSALRSKPTELHDYLFFIYSS